MVYDGYDESTYRHTLCVNVGGGRCLLVKDGCTFKSGLSRKKML